MPTTTPLTDAINALTRYANETTGASDTTLSEAVNTLIEGYGQGGGGSSSGLFLLKTFNINAENTVNLPIDFTWFDSYPLVIFVPNLTFSVGDWMYGGADGVAQNSYTNKVSSVDARYSSVVQKKTNGKAVSAWFRNPTASDGNGAVIYANIATSLHFHMYTASVTMTGDFKVYGVDFTTAQEHKWTTDGIAQNLEPNGDIVLGSSVTKIESGAFWRKPITSLTAPEVVTIGDSCVRYCTSLKSINMPKATSNAGDANYLFADCTNLETVYLPEMTSMGSYMLATCRKLTNVFIPKVKSIRPNSFQNDNVLPCIDIGADCTDIQGNAFNACHALQLMVLRRTASVTTLANVSAFTNSPFRGYNSLTADLYVPSALISSYQSASNWSTILTEGYTTIHAIEGSIYETQYADGTPIE